MRDLSYQRFAIGALSVTLGLALGGVSAWGQERPNNTGSSTGSAVPRSGGDGGGGGSAAPRGGGDSGGSSSSGASSSRSGGSDGGSMGSSSSPSFPQGFEAPSRAQSSGASRPRSNSSGESTGRAVSRNGGSSGSSSEGRSASPSSVRAGSGDQSSTTRNAVPRYSRPNDGRPITGHAVERVGLPPGSGNIIFYPYYPYYPYGFWGAGYGFGLGYMYFDPFWYGGYGYGYPGYGGYGGGGYSSSSQSYREEGGLRLKIDPREAQVFIDGYYVGLVDSFDGTFQKLSIESGAHKVELKADGFEPLQFDVLITPGDTVTYKGKMNRIK